MKREESRAKESIDMGEQKNSGQRQNQDNNLPEWLTQFKQELGAKAEEKVAGNEFTQVPLKGSSASSEQGRVIGAQKKDIKPYAFFELAGYKNAINSLCDVGFGTSSAAQKDGIIAALNNYHGIKSKPALPPIVLTGKCFEDIKPLLNAALEEMSQPTVVLGFQESSHGVPMMTVNANGAALNASGKQPALQWVASNHGILVIDAIEYWIDDASSQIVDFGNGIGALVQFKMGPNIDVGEMIDIAVDNPEVQIVCTTCESEEYEADILDYFGSCKFIEIDNPDLEEREEIWTQQAGKHPSLRTLDLKNISRLTRGLSRYDIQQSVQDAISDSYHSGLRNGNLQEVTKENIFEKVCLRMDDKDCEEFREMQDVLIASFAKTLD